MSSRGALFVLVSLLFVALASPVLAGQADCTSEDEDECCGLDCPLCLCCSHLPRPISDAASFGLADGPSGGVGSDGPLGPAAPAPRDILHVPKLVSIG